MKIGNYVLVTTSFRGVFAGELVETGEGMVTLKDARNCRYWTTDVDGFLGLSVTGPLKGCKIGPATELVDLFGVTSISLCSDEAKVTWISF